MNASTLSQLEMEIQKKCAQYFDGVHPQYHPHLPQMRSLTLMCLQFLANEQDLYQVISDQVKTKPGISGKLSDLLLFIASDVEEKGEISFYHFLGMLSALSFHYSKMVQEESYKDLNLADEVQWASLTWEACVWSIFYVAGTLFEEPLKQHNEVFNEAKGGIDEIILFIKKKLINQNET